MAAVAFTEAELRELIRGAVGQPSERQAPRLMRAFAAATMRTARRVMDIANEVLDGSGIEYLFGREGRVVTDPWDAVELGSYVNFGDTYVATLLYDREANEFRIQSWGDFVEGWEEEYGAAREDVCGTCGDQYPATELEFNEEGTEATCRNCLNPPLSVWYPSRWENPPLVAMLRSIEGDEVAVHFWDDRPIGLAFSVPLGHETFSAQQIKGRSSDEPYIEEYEKLYEHFKRSNVKDVAYLNRSVNIEREMFQRLHVAMDTFFSTGGKFQPEKEFLKVPPVLWTCDQIDHVQWSEGEGGHNLPAAVEAYVGDYMTADSFSVWAASGRELEELVTDGFIKFGDDRTVREYLKSIGVCRAT